MKKIKVVKETSDEVTLEVSFKLSKSMLDTEKNIQSILNEVGSCVTGKALSEYDTDGSPIKLGNQTFTSKGFFEKNYQTPYGETRVSRHVYQSHSGGKTYCPLEDKARIVVTSTPRFAMMVSCKYSYGSTEHVKQDFINNHERPVNRKTLQTISEAVGSVAMAKEVDWEYLPNPDELEKVEVVSFGLDGTCMQMREDGWREAMAGTISLYNKDGDRVHTHYLAAAPEYGKKKFLDNLEESINKTIDLFPDSKKIGLADGARENWGFLENFCDYQVIDFYHVTTYLGSYSKAIYKTEKEQKEWFERACSDLKSKHGSASRLYNEIKEEAKNKHKKKDQEVIDKTLSYFKNNVEKMKYKKMMEMGSPIGSGVTEAACKVIVKERMCKAGMRWKNDGAQLVLKLRTMTQTTGHWDHFWNKVDQYGFEMVA